MYKKSNSLVSPQNKNHLINKWYYCNWINKKNDDGINTTTYQWMKKIEKQKQKQKQKLTKFAIGKKYGLGNECYCQRDINENSVVSHSVVSVSASVSVFIF